MSVSTRQKKIHSLVSGGQKPHNSQNRESGAITINMTLEYIVGWP